MMKRKHCRLKCTIDNVSASVGMGARARRSRHTYSKPPYAFANNGSWHCWNGPTEVAEPRDPLEGVRNEQSKVKVSTG